jgi:hypothetical protein
MVTPLDQAVDAWNAEHGDHTDLRTLIGSALLELDQLLPLAGGLVDTHQRGIGFLTVEAAKVMNDLVRSERRDRIAQAKDGIKLTGPVPAPGSIAAYSLREEAQRVCDELAQILTTRLNRAGVCLIPTPPIPANWIGIHDPHVARLADLVAVTRRTSTLRVIHGHVEDITTRVRRLIDGNDTKALPEPCPFCHRHTLVAYLAEDQEVIRCERDPKTGQHETCICDDSYCHCKTGGRRRHEWHRNKGSQKWGWYGLRQDQDLASRTTTTTPTN